jgi:hypothetical protein
MPKFPSFAKRGKDGSLRKKGAWLAAAKGVETKMSVEIMQGAIYETY